MVNFSSQMQIETMENRTGEQYMTPTSPRAIEFILMICYVFIFAVGLAGNVLIVISVVKFKELKTVVNVFLANLAIADALFVILSTFDAAQFVLQEWIFGDLLCRIQSTAIEVSYTVSVVTLATVAVERYLCICFPYRRKRTVKQSICLSLLIWVFAIIFCGILMYGYQSKEESGSIKCANDNWSNQTRLVFYIVHSVVVYLFPLIILCLSHYRISRVLAQQRKRCHDRLSSRHNSSTNIHFKTPHTHSNLSESDGTSTRMDETPTDSTSKGLKVNTLEKQSRSLRILTRRCNVIGLLVVITSIFITLWSPFIVVRLLMYADVQFDQVIFRASQMLFFTNTAVNFIVYALMSTSFRRAFKSLFSCGRREESTWNASYSKSFDVADTLKKSFSFNKSLPKEEVKLNE